jgi:ribonucleotide monophosphatase NagD (HAD superfamily)
MTRLITALSEIAQGYDALFVDLWGCVHDGVRALPEACAALSAYREGGGAVVLVTNSPRPRGDVERQLRHFGVPDNAWDTIATSGDSARAALFTGAVGHRVWFIGQPQEVIFFDPIKVVEDPVEITRVDPDEAEGIVCTGPFDPMAEPEVMRPQFLAAKTRGLKLLCANPDIVVDRGEVREWCAGALARLYTEMGADLRPCPPPPCPAWPRRGRGAHPCHRRRCTDRYSRRHGRGYRFPLHHRRAGRTGDKNVAST